MNSGTGWTRGRTFTVTLETVGKNGEGYAAERSRASSATGLLKVYNRYMFRHRDPGNPILSVRFKMSRDAALSLGAKNHPQYGWYWQPPSTPFSVPVVVLELPPKGVARPRGISTWTPEQRAEFYEKKRAEKTANLAPAIDLLTRIVEIGDRMIDAGRRIADATERIANATENGWGK